MPIALEIVCSGINCLISRGKRDRYFHYGLAVHGRELSRRPIHELPVCGAIRRLRQTSLGIVGKTGRVSQR